MYTATHFNGFIKLVPFLLLALLPFVHREEFHLEREKKEALLGISESKNRMLNLNVQNALFLLQNKLHMNWSSEVSKPLEREIGKGHGLTALLRDFDTIENW